MTLENIESGGFGLKTFRNAREAILEIGSRHPLRLDQAHKMEVEFAENGTIERMLNDAEILETFYNNLVYLIPSQFVTNRLQHKLLGKIHEQDQQ